MQIGIVTPSIKTLQIFLGIATEKNSGSENLQLPNEIEGAVGSALSIQVTVTRKLGCGVMFYFTLSARDQVTDVRKIF